MAISLKVSISEITSAKKKKNSYSSSKNASKKSPNPRVFSCQKGSERFAEPLNRTSNLPNLYLGPKNRTSNLPNLKKPNEPPNRTRFDPTLLPTYQVYTLVNQTFDNKVKTFALVFLIKFSIPSMYLLVLH